MGYYDRLDVDVLLGKTLTKVENENNERVHFWTAEGEHYMLYHEQDCCEYVRLEEFHGEFDDLVGEPILMSEVVSNEPEPETPKGGYGDDSHTWTFYKFATVKGYVTLRWLGTSNGYYSESVSFELMDSPPEVKAEPKLPVVNPFAKPLRTIVTIISLAQPRRNDLVFARSNPVVVDDALVTIDERIAFLKLKRITIEGWIPDGKASWLYDTGSDTYQLYVVHPDNQVTGRLVAWFQTFV